METTLTVYALAYGGKFIGQGQSGVAYLTVTDANGQVVAGQSRQPITQGGKGDGSGITKAILAAYPWGYPMSTAEAYSYTFSVPLTAPTQWTFTVEVFHAGVLKSTASVQRNVWPGLQLVGPMSVIVVVPGLLCDLLPADLPSTFQVGQPAVLTAHVYMMCGCQIDNHFWPGVNFDVRVVVTDADGAAVATVPLAWSSISTYTGSWTPGAAGAYGLRAFVVEVINGNTGVSASVSVSAGASAG